MTLMKSVLLGSAATLMVVAGAQAADLPTKKGAPAAEYVKVCKIGGIAGFVIPGSDTCLKISGGIMAMTSFQTLDDGFVPLYTAAVASAAAATVSSSFAGTVSVGGTQAATFSAFAGSHAAIPAAAGWSGVATKYRDSFGMYARADLGLEAVSNTAYGPLTSVIDIHWDQGYGANQAGPSWTYINNAYVQWAGITAGIKGSFFDYLGGGQTWYDIISPTHSNTGIPLFAYTASFGGGFAATLSFEENANGTNGRATETQGPEAFFGYATDTFLGNRAPDIVGALDLTQGWGTVHVAAVAHNYRIEDAGLNDVDGWGWAAIGGLGFNLPQLGAGDDIKFQASYSYAAVGYSGLNSAGWGGGGGGGNNYGINFAGNGYLYALQDAVSTGGGVWSIPTTWTVAAVADFNLTPQFKISPEISYGEVSWSNRGMFANLEGDAYSWTGGAAFTWTPVTNLSFDLDLVYQYSHLGASTSGLYPANDPSGFNGRIKVERDF